MLEQVNHHIKQILEIRLESDIDRFKKIPCELKFINGELDEYTPASEMRLIAPYLKNSEF
jgi:rhamnosyltransferase subunit A